MPRLTGTELARVVAPLRPEVPILLYTGYRDGVPQSELAAGGIRAVLDKPVDPAALHEQLQRYLRSGVARKTACAAADPARLRAATPSTCRRRGAARRRSAAARRGRCPGRSCARE